ncbi:MAG: site-specific integrase, partial [Candidatus Nanopelagicales bacterium]
MTSKTTATALPKGVDLLPSGRFRARLTHEGRAHTTVVDSAREASVWLLRTRAELAAGVHESQDPTEQDAPAGRRQPTLTRYSDKWLAARELRAATRLKYRRHLDRDILPVFGSTPLDAITVASVRDWHETLHPHAPGMRAHAYALLRAILNDAYREDRITANPCRVKGAGNTSGRLRQDVPTVAQVAALAAAMPDAKQRCLLLVSAWCGLRYGEATELRVKDVVTGPDGLPAAIRVRRGVVCVQGEYLVGPPKTHAGMRDVTIPPHVRAELGAWVAELGDDPDRLLFPSNADPDRHMSSAQHHDVWRVARDKIGRPDLRWHGLR